MFTSRGFKLASAGFVLLLGGAAVLLVSKPAGVAMMLLGGMAVFSGFIWTLLEYYITPDEPEE